MSSNQRLKLYYPIGTLEAPASVNEVELVARIQGLSDGTISGLIYVQKQHTLEA